MTQALPENSELIIRPAQYRDLEAVERLYAEALEADGIPYSINPQKPLRPSGFWSGWLMKWLILLLTRPQKTFCAYLADQTNKLQGLIRVSAFNRTRTTWRVDRVAVPAEPLAAELSSGNHHHAPSQFSSGLPATGNLPVAGKILLSDVGSQLLRYCFEIVWEARTWLLEIDVNDKELLALYRKNGFQPLAHATYWEIPVELLQDLAEREPDLPNLLPVSNADAQLLYQLDTVAMPPLLRQVFDRHILDFKTSLFGSLLEGVRNWLNQVEVVSGYVFEPQRKAAIGYFQVQLCRDGSRPHQAQLTVHPAYTWLYPELLSQMARIAQDLPSQSMQLASLDYQPEREDYLKRLGANRIAHTLMMSRSVWHKLRESKTGALEGLQLSEVLQGFQPARKPVPGRISLLPSVSRSSKADSADNSHQIGHSSAKLRKRPNRRLLNLTPPTDFSDPPSEGPCC
jgi:hypothetical protein